MLFAAAIGLGFRIRQPVAGDHGLRYPLLTPQTPDGISGTHNAPLAVDSRYFLGIRSSIDSPAACPMRVYQMALPK
jgi:hypothetical protein